MRIITQLRGNASTPCEHAIKATPLMLRFAGLCAHSLTNSQNSLRACRKPLRCFVPRHVCIGLLALCEAYGKFGGLAGNSNRQRAARAQLRRDETQPLAQWRLAARTRPQNCRCPRAFGPLQSCLHAVWTQLCPVACHEYRLDVSAGVWQHHQID